MLADLILDFDIYYMSRIEKLKDYLQASPDDSFLQHALALEYVKIGEDAEGQKLFEKILQRDPGYVGTYYHLAKLLERNGNSEHAIAWYEKGMVAAKKASDNHSYNELRMALEDLIE